MIFSFNLCYNPPKGGTYAMKPNIEKLRKKYIENPQKE